MKAALFIFALSIAVACLALPPSFTIPMNLERKGIQTNFTSSGGASFTTNQWVTSINVPGSINGGGGTNGGQITFNASSNITISSLGSYKTVGDYGVSHVIRLCDASSNTVAIITTNTTDLPTNQFNYYRLTSPVTVTAGSKMFLMYDGQFENYLPNATVNVTGVATADNATFDDGFSPDGQGAGHIRGPLSFEYYY